MELICVGIHWSWSERGQHRSEWSTWRCGHSDMWVWSEDKWWKQDCSISVSETASDSSDELTRVATDKWPVSCLIAHTAPVVAMGLGEWEQHITMVWDATSEPWATIKCSLCQPNINGMRTSDTGHCDSAMRRAKWFPLLCCDLMPVAMCHWCHHTDLSSVGSMTTRCSATSSEVIIPWPKYVLSCCITMCHNGTNTRITQSWVAFSNLTTCFLNTAKNASQAQNWFSSPWNSETLEERIWLELPYLIFNQRDNIFE